MSMEEHLGLFKAPWIADPQMLRATARQQRYNDLFTAELAAWCAELGTSLSSDTGLFVDFPTQIQAAKSYAWYPRMHELDVIELTRPVDGYPSGAHATIVSVPSPAFAWAEIDESIERSDDETGLIGVTPADIRIVVAA